jgi:membrane protein
VVYEEEEKRSFIRLYAVTLSFTIATIAFLLTALACVVARSRSRSVSFLLRV